MTEKEVGVIWTDRELLRRATAALLEHDAQVEPNQYLASWTWFARGGFAAGLEAAVKVQKNEETGEYTTQPRWMFFASTSFLPPDIRRAFIDPTLFDKVIKKYREKLDMSLADIEEADHYLIWAKDL